MIRSFNWTLFGISPPALEVGLVELAWEQRSLLVRHHSLRHVSSLAEVLVPSPRAPVFVQKNDGPNALASFRPAT